MIFSPIPLIIILFAFFYGFIMVMRVMRRTRNRVVRTENFDFTIAELHGLLAAGKLSPEEYERARTAVAARNASSPATPRDPRRGFEVKL